MSETSETKRMDPTTREGLRTVAGVLVAVAARLEQVAAGAQEPAQIKNAAAVLEGQAVVLREWYMGQLERLGFSRDNANAVMLCTR
jgi:hypothetical protein